MRFLTALLVLAVSCGGSATAVGQQTIRVPFTTTAHEDVLHTTADWDTAAARIGLFRIMEATAGSFDTPGSCRGVAVAGDLAFVADGGYGFQVIDMSDPVHPFATGSCSTPGTALAVAVAGDLAFVADDGAGLQVIDITDPAHPVIVGALDTPGRAQHVVVAGGHAFVADEAGGLQVIAIGDPTRPEIVGHCETPGYAWGVAIEGGRAFVADFHAGLQVIDIGDLTSPVIMGGVDTPGQAVRVAVSAGHAYVADNLQGLHSIDVRDPAHPVLRGTCYSSGNLWDVAVQGDRAYAADYDLGLLAVDISDPAHPALTGTLGLPDHAMAVAVRGRLAFVADHEAGLQIVPIADAGPLQTVGTHTTSEAALRATVAGDFAYVADLGAGLEIVDISNPAAPVTAARYATAGLIGGVVVRGDRAFLAEESAGLVVLDVTDPLAPSHVATLPLSGPALGLEVAGDVAYVAAGEAGVLTVAVGDPSRPVEIGSFNTPGSALNVCVDGNLCFVADSGGGLRVVDVRDPAAPVGIGGCATAGPALAVDVAGDMAFVAAGASGFQVIDVSDPALPRSVATPEWLVDAVDVAVSSDVAYVASATTGLHVLDVSDPERPVPAATSTTIERAWNVAVDAELVHVCAGPAGLVTEQYLQTDLITSRNVAQSVPLAGDGSVIGRARLRTSQRGGVAWQLSTDGGGHWQGALPGDGWLRLAHPGSELAWRAELQLVDPDTAPAIDSLEIDWLTDQAEIQSLADVPADNGGWVTLVLGRSGFDFEDEEELPVLAYEIWRRIATPSPGTVIRGTGTAPGAASAGFPPGDWELVADVPAARQDSYAAVVPAVVYSTEDRFRFSVYVVKTVTSSPSHWYLSAPDSAFSIDSLAPEPPRNLTTVHEADRVLLDWDDAAEPDSELYRIYRAAAPDLHPYYLIREVSISACIDSIPDPRNHRYRVTAVDSAGNESAPTPGDVLSIYGIFVSPQGRDGGSGTDDDPLATIQQAVFLAAAGDTILLMDGAYRGPGNRDIDLSDKNLTIRSVSGDPDACLIDAEWDATGSGWIMQGRVAALEGLTLKRATAGVLNTRSSVVLRNCVIDGAGFGVQARQGNVNVYDSRLTACTIGLQTNWYEIYASNCVFEACGTGVDFDGDEGGWFYDCEFRDNDVGMSGLGGRPVFRNCVFARNGTGLAIRMSIIEMEDCEFFGNTAAAADIETFWLATIDGTSFHDNPGTGLTVSGDSPITVASTTIVRNGTGFVSALEYGVAEITDTIIAFNAGEGLSDNGATYTNCDVYGNGPDLEPDSWSAGENGNVELDPLFCGPEDGDFGLAASSPCAESSGRARMGAAGVACVHGPAPVVAGVSDVPADQGGRARLRWYRSELDAAGSPTPVTGYDVYRRIDGGDPAAERTAAKLLGWEFVVHAPARGDLLYEAIVATEADSTVTGGAHWSVYMVSAVTGDPTVFFDSAPDSGYSLDNLAPAAPTAFSVAYSEWSTVLDWADSKDPDLWLYRVYRGDEPDFVPDASMLVQEVVASGWVDRIAAPWDHHYYRITAVDLAGNESVAASVSQVSGTDLPAAAITYALGDPVPNPFNPSTRIRYTIPADGDVRLTVYDVAGRRVVTLVDEARPAGVHTVEWDGRDTSGRQAASGVYFYQLRAGSFVQSKRMVLLK